VKVGDLVKQRSIGMPRQDKSIGVILEVRENPDPHRCPAVLAYWGPGHKMNDRYVTSIGLEVVVHTDLV
jgi:hypothetical protein